MVVAIPRLVGGQVLKGVHACSRECLSGNNWSSIGDSLWKTLSQMNMYGGGALALRRLSSVSCLHSSKTTPMSVQFDKDDSLTYDVAQKLFPNRLKTSGLKELFEPKSIAIVGATERQNSVGRTLVSNLLSSKAERNSSYKIYSVNQGRTQVLGTPCYRSIKDIPDDIDMVVIVTPAKSCVEVMRQCAEKNVKAAVVISAGFREAGEEGLALENELVSVARDGGIRVVGPNCLGVMNPVYGLNATFSANMGQPGRLAFISQSGAMCTSVLDWSLKHDIGFSAFVSIGGMADVNWGDLLDYLGDDVNTSAILMYMEGAGNAEALLAAAKETAMKKPIVVIKAGKSEAAAAAAASHTGSLAGSYKSFEAAMSRTGVLTVDNIQQLFDAALVLGKQPRPRGPNLLIVTNAGGPAVLATDAIVASGAVPAKLSPSLRNKLEKFLPPAWSRSNPIDILGDAPPERFCQTLEEVLLHTESEAAPDGVLVILSPQDQTDPKESALALVRAVENARREGKADIPVLAAWMGGVSVEEGSMILSRAGIPAFSNPDDAAFTFGRLWKQAEALDTLYKSDDETRDALTDVFTVTHKEKVISLLEHVKRSNRQLLTEAESKQVLTAYGISVVPTIIALTEQEAVHAARNLDSPTYAVKLHSETLTHKADVGGVRLNVPENQIAEAFNSIRSSVQALHGLQHFQGVTVQPMISLDKGIELILGSTVDPQFGPLVLFGSGGSMVEIFKDTSLAVPPLTNNLSDMLLRSTRIHKALKGAQGKRFEGVDMKKLRDVINRFSEMVVDLSSYIAECDINPLLATKDNQFIALDARIVLGASSATPIVRPYPSMYSKTLRLPRNQELHIRPVVETDRAHVKKFFERLTKDELAKRFLQIPSASHVISSRALTSMCFADYDRRITLIARDAGNSSIKAICELERPPKTHLKTFPAQIRVAAVASPGEELTEHLFDYALEVAKSEGINSVVTYRLASDTPFAEFALKKNPSSPWRHTTATVEPVTHEGRGDMLVYTFTI